MSIADIANREPLPELPPARERVKLRNRFGVTQRTAATALGVSRQTFNAWERGNAEPTGDNLKRYAELLAAWKGRLNDRA